MEQEQQQQHEEQPSGAHNARREDTPYKREGWVCLNKHSHPATTKCCSAECCMMCCGYCSPTGVAVLVAALIIAQWVYHFIIMANYPSAWKIVVSIIIMLLLVFFGAAVLYAYYMVIFTSPGYVPADPWKYPPRYVGRAPLRQEGGGEQQLQPQQGEGQDVQHTALPHPVYGNLNPLMDERPLEEQNRREGEPQRSKEEEGAAGSLAGQERHSPFSHASAPTAGTGTGSTQVEIGGAPIAGKDKQLEEADPMSTREGGSGGAASGDSGGGSNPFTVTQLDGGGRLRYCVKCQQYKPDSAHHCHICGRCIYYFDHHCAWINNCVGRNNYKLFVVFVQYGAIACIVCAGLSVIGLFAMDEHEMGKKIGWIAIPAVMLVLGLTLAIFRLQLCCQLRKGQTTLETIIESEARQRERRSVGGYFASLRRKKPKPTAEEKQREKVEHAERVKAFQEEMLGPNPRCPRSFLPIPVRTDDSAAPTVSLLKED